MSYQVCIYVVCYTGINSVIDKIVRKGEKGNLAFVCTDLKTLLHLEPYIQLTYIEIFN